MTFPQRNRVLIGLISAGILASFYWFGCGASFTTRDPVDTTDDSGAPVAGSRQAELPSGHVNVLAEWEAGDIAFRSGDPEEAQVRFGTVYIVDPNFGGGQVVAALHETCRIIQNDCALVMGRLDTLRIVYTEQHGARSTWVEQQATDYDAILGCYDNALAGDFDMAYAAGYGVVNAPLPTFSQLARLCLDRVQIIRAQIAAHEQWLRAIEDWDDLYPEFAAADRLLREAIEEDDWDAIVNTYPDYKIVEETIAIVADSGALSGDQVRGPDAEAAMESVVFFQEWEEENYETYEIMRDGLNSLEDSREYNEALIEYERTYEPIPGLREEIATLEVAASATSGTEARSINRRIDAKENEIRDIRRALRRIMADINDLREDVGLPSRDAPYGLE